MGAHTIGYNSKSMGISFIGCFMRQLPTEAALNACKNFLKRLVVFETVYLLPYCFVLIQFHFAEVLRKAVWHQITNLLRIVSVVRQRALVVNYMKSCKLGIIFTISVKRRTMNSMRYGNINLRNQTNFRAVHVTTNCQNGIK